MSFNLSSKFCAYNKVVQLENSEMQCVIGLSQENDEIKNIIAKNFNQKRRSERQRLLFRKISTEECLRKLSKEFSNALFLKKVEEKEKEKSHFDDVPIKNILNSMIIECLENKGSDIHLQRWDNFYELRFRINGTMKTQSKINAEIGDALMQRVKVLSKLDLAEKRKCQDGRFDFLKGDYEAELRVSVIPCFYGESLVLRILDRKKNIENFSSLGFTGEQEKMLDEIVKSTSGLVLICGPTGSGKTTSMSSILGEIQKQNKKIISLEDPVEYIIPNVTQVQINKNLGLDFPTLLRSVIRQDPDIVAIGEIRDSATAKIAVQTALTGHLVLATLHTDSARDSFFRLTDMGVPAYLLSSVLKWVICQELVVLPNSRKLNASITYCDSDFLSELKEECRYGS
ncbi:MAG TPA: GspE/PulE family protein [Treponemataceae bacterium]|jgi:type IV pilus assembly protein PilB|nr:GspE/PulE family protein [Treponemataceae bacterium]HOQ93344.1 GspE/PulE family protein [Treponemataceae bacterium]HPM06419.1 GspE/PulE family protein [Treponemataceae bacterium]HPY52995.1 GspE/PulE family protein [Treponemataceae bacterium]